MTEKWEIDFEDLSLEELLELYETENDDYKAEITEELERRNGLGNSTEH